MKKQYNGLEACKICFNKIDISTTSGYCAAMIQLRMENGVCVSPPFMQQVEYVGDQGGPVPKPFIGHYIR